MYSCVIVTVYYLITVGTHCVLFHSGEQHSQSHPMHAMYKQEFTLLMSRLPSGLNGIAKDVS